MKFIIYALISLFCFSSLLYSETKKDNLSYEFGFKIQQSTYLPYEFKSIRSDPFIDKSELKNNKNLIYPFFVKFRNYDKKYGIDFDVMSLRTNNPYFESFQLSSNSFYNSKYEIGNIERNEINLNFLYMPLPNPKILYFGFGLKKLDREYQYNPTSLIGTNYDKFNTYGFNIPIRSNIQIFDNFFLNLALDPYLTVGKRHFIEQTALNANSSLTGNYPIIWYTYTNPNAITQVTGFQADVSISYIFFDNFKFYIGINRNQSQIRYINSNEKEYRYYGDQKYLLFFPESQDSRFDTINSFYFGSAFML
jgi:outer membrane protein (TIGR04327 family)